MTEALLRRRPTAGVVAVAASLSITFGAVTAAEAPVSEIVQIEGAAMVNHRDSARYVDARVGMALRPQDRIVVMDNSRAVLHFSDGCMYTMSDSELLTISERSACVESQAQQADTQVQDSATIEVQERFASIERFALSQGNSAIPGGTRLTWRDAAVGAAIIGGVFLLWDDDDDGGVVLFRGGGGSDEDDVTVPSPS